MTYNPAEIEPIDIIRGRLLDTSDDPATEYLTDDIYFAILARHTDWRLAGAEIAGRIYRMIAARPVQLGSDGDAIRWSEARATSIKEEQQRFLDEAAIAASGANVGVVTFTTPFLTGVDDGGLTW